MGVSRCGGNLGPYSGDNTMTDVLWMTVMSHPEKVKRRMPCILKAFPCKVTVKKVCFPFKAHFSYLGIYLSKNSHFSESVECRRFYSN